MMARSRKLCREEIILWLGNGAKVVALAIGIINLALNNGLVLVL